MIVTAGAVFCQTPPELQKVCGLYEAHQAEMKQLHENRQKLAGTVPPGENPFEFETRRNKVNEMAKTMEARHRAFLEASSNSFGQTGSFSNWTGVLTKLNYFPPVDSPQKLKITVTLTCTGSSGSMPVELLVVAENLIHTQVAAAAGGLPANHPLLASLRSLHVNDKVRISGRFVYYNRSTQKFVSRGALVSSRGDSDWEGQSLHGFVVLSTIERVQ